MVSDIRKIFPDASHSCLHVIVEEILSLSAYLIFYRGRVRPMFCIVCVSSQLRFNTDNIMKAYKPQRVAGTNQFPKKRMTNHRK